MVHHTQYTKYQEELPIGAARRAIIVRIWPGAKVVANIIADYAMLTEDDKLSLFAPGNAGRVTLSPNIYEGDMQIHVNWKLKKPNGTKIVFYLSTWRTFDSVSKVFNLRDIIYDHNKPWLCKSKLNEIPQLKPFFHLESGFELFFTMFNREMAKIV